jgi:nitrile hydratase subunit beta
MNGVHDMGGMHGFGPVVHEENEPVFHAPWEKRVFAMALSVRLAANIDERRHAIERMDPAHYLLSSYYERWLARLETQVVEKGILTPEELATGVAKDTGRPQEKPLNPEEAMVRVRQGVPAQRQSGRLSPRFKVGDRVVARNLHPAGHTRLPRYIRGKRGIIDRVHGTFVYPDTNAHGRGEQPQPLYCVRFEARELWGAEASAREYLYIDLWEDYFDLM